MDHGVGSRRTALRNVQEKAVTRRKHSYKFGEWETRRHSKEELRRWLGEGAELLLHKCQRRSLDPISPQKSWAQEPHTVLGGSW